MRALVFDTETTGLITNRTVKMELWPEIIEFASALIDWDTGEKLEEYSTLIKPRKKLEDKIVEITGIDNDMLVDQPSFLDVSTEIWKRITEADLVVAHNASFDCEMVEMEFERVGQTIVIQNRLCTVEQTMGIKGFRMRLSDLHEHLFGLAHENGHRAGTDVNALVRVVAELRKREVI